MVDSGKIILGSISIIIVFMVIGSCVAIVDAGHRGVILHWSAVDVTNPPLSEGLHFITPVMDSVINIEVRTLKNVQSVSAASQDLQDVKTEVTLNYKLSPENVHKLYKNIGLDYESRIINPAIEETIKQVAATYNAAELITKRPLVKDDVTVDITMRLAEYNIIAEVVSITNFEFSKQFAAAVESKVVAEQRAQKAENDLARIKVEALQQKAAAVGIADANIAEATGEAQAIEIINNALASNPKYLEWQTIKKWDGILPLVTGDGATPFISIPEGK